MAGIVEDPFRGVSAQIWAPLGLDLANEDRGVHLIFPIGRLKKGVSLDQARAEMTTHRRPPGQAISRHQRRVGASVSTALHDFVVKDVRPRLLILFAAVAAVLLIACSNLMNLFLARFATREREMAIRAALGAGRWRVTRQLLTEVLLIALVGSAIGVLLARWGTQALLALNTKAVPRAGEIGVDGRVLLFALGVAILAGLAAGLWPALRASRPDLQEPLREGARTVSGGVRGKFVRNSLVMTEVAAALVLLVAAGLLIKGFARLNDIDPGFRTDHGLTARVYLPAAKYEEAARQIAAWDAILAAARSLPGVEKASLVSRMPLAEHRVLKGGAYLPGQVPDSENDVPIINLRTVSPETFAALGIPLRAGRAPQATDGTDSAKVTVINQALADRLWPGAPSVVGRQMIYESATSGPIQATVIGVAGNLRNNGLEAEGDMEVYVPYPQAPLNQMTLAESTLILKTAGDPAALSGALRNAVSSYDADLPVSDVQTLETIVDQALSPARFGMLLIALFAGLALVLAAVGVYGVISYSVAQRTQEIGIRMAIGADRGAVLRMVLWQSLALALFGIGVGLAFATGLTRFLAGQLYGVSATDPAIFAAVSCLLTFVALVASWVPARRATGVDPLTTMRR